MNTSRAVGYGLLVINYFAKHKDQKVATAEIIAKEYSMDSHLYLFKIMKDLVKANILRSARGPHGGYSLAKPLNKINMLEIIEVIEGPMQSRLSMTEFAPKEKFCIKIDKAYEKAITEVRKVLKNTKLSDLV
ncbi:MAG: RrF2 family transcriptional regulator [Planctomycetota bacterium]|jgi:Rrf2 family protein